MPWSRLVGLAPPNNDESSPLPPAAAPVAKTSGRRSSVHAVHDWTCGRADMQGMVPGRLIGWQDAQHVTGKAERARTSSKERVMLARHGKGQDRESNVCIVTVVRATPCSSLSRPPFVSPPLQLLGRDRARICPLRSYAALQSMSTRSTNSTKKTLPPVSCYVPLGHPSPWRLPSCRYPPASKQQFELS